MNTTICAIIPTFRRWKYLLSTVEQLLQQSHVPNEIIIIDQTPEEEIEASDGNRLGRLIKKYPFILYQHQKKPHVYKARNLAITLAKSEILLYLDDDITLFDHTVANHLGHYADNRISAVSGSVVRTEKEGGTPVSDKFMNSSHVVQAFTYLSYFKDPMQDIGFMYANNFSVRKKILIKIGGWDEHVLNYGDRDLGIRLCLAGYRIDYDPHAKLIHHAAPIGGTRVTDRKNVMEPWKRCVSLHYLAWRHLNGWMFVRYGLFRAARFSFLLKQNALRPYKWPSEIAGFLKGLYIARQWVKDGVKSPFVTNNLNP